ncbi:rRNA biogenesis protein RRP36 [Wickerhamiella sorbophila]|uniref:rRNA biogenesis protein RRP36 n=1 Tax=Wickerhamiella sorbophila TaxID=45607 RepID=A0A2T0FIR6_9ASCO|nr:rRNA biogenesis protein RRP36 [Wickerhamiella sorbophila]PRT54893.1 rRNA biogenesis protein RRP36 [Wickerhamiella sorbophila]
MKRPSEQSSKKPVSRLRAIPGLEPKNTSLYQDPRFDTALGKADLQQTRKNYAFLDEYRQAELKQMKEELAKSKDLKEQEILEKAIRSQASRLETFKRRDQEAEILRKIKNQPISRAKKREIVLKERFAAMSKKDASRVIEKRRRKVAQKQKKALPDRRV